jgi:hypothetical protein
MAKFKNNKNFLNEINHRFLLTTKLLLGERASLSKHKFLLFLRDELMRRSTVLILPL